MLQDLGEQKAAVLSGLMPAFCRACHTVMAKTWAWKPADLGLNLSTASEKLTGLTCLFPPGNNTDSLGVAEKIMGYLELGTQEMLRQYSLRSQCWLSAQHSSNDKNKQNVASEQHYLFANSELIKILFPPLRAHSHFPRKTRL